ncbi:MAG: dihydrofolate reductase family protein [Cyanobacteriota bacterium]|nr:dihydrofolate reductase family protein [Cyanobacteriota bacterium]
MRKLIYYIACTVDGFIAREDGRFDFFPTEGEHLAYLVSEFPETIPVHLQNELGVTRTNKHFDIVVMGRRTYEVGTNVGIRNPYPQMRQIVFSHTMSDQPDAAVELVREDAIGTIRQLKQEDGLDIWLCGGAELASALYSEIDELMLKVNPVAIGVGLPLFGRVEALRRFDLVANQVFNNGFMLNHYSVFI